MENLNFQLLNNNEFIFTNEQDFFKNNQNSDVFMKKISLCKNNITTSFDIDAIFGVFYQETVKGFRETIVIDYKKLFLLQ